jgi:hypothetical protein
MHAQDLTVHGIGGTLLYDPRPSPAPSQADGFKGVDVLLTSEWPLGITRLAPVPPAKEKGCVSMAHATDWLHRHCAFSPIRSFRCMVTL